MVESGTVCESGVVSIAGDGVDRHGVDFSEHDGFDERCELFRLGAVVVADDYVLFVCE